MTCTYYRDQTSVCLRKPLFCPWHLCLKHLVWAIINLHVDAVIVRHELRVHD